MKKNSHSQDVYYESLEDEIIIIFHHHADAGNTGGNSGTRALLYEH